MKNILSAACRPVLDRFAWSNALLAFDFDGTLAPIVADPSTAAMRASTRRLFGLVARRYPCVVISGRARADVAARVEGIRLHRVIGNHGVEPWQGARSASRVVAEWRDELRDRLHGLGGVVIEDKIYSIAVHYRHSREKKVARLEILRATSWLTGARIIRGKLVVNVVPAGAPHKGMALERERDQLECDTAIYVGDDETDEDVFGLEARDRLLGIRVGAKRSTHADYFIREQRDIDGLLGALLSQRPGPMAGEEVARV